LAGWVVLLVKDRPLRMEGHPAVVWRDGLIDIGESIKRVVPPGEDPRRTLHEVKTERIEQRMTQTRAARAGHER